jgi:hypothetical protein
MRVACETPAIATARLVCELKAEGEEERAHEFDERLAIAQQLKVGRFILKINRDGAVFAGLTGGVVHGSPSGQMVVGDDDLRWAILRTFFERKGLANEATNWLNGLSNLTPT